MPITSYLVKGDISGIQSFIFNVKSKGAAGSIKGRSFLVKLLHEMGMYRVLNDFKVSDWDQAKISTSGGSFTLMLPIDDEKKLELIQNDFNQALQFIGLSLFFGWVEYDVDKHDYSNRLKELNQKCSQSKLTEFRSSHSYFEPKEKSPYTDAQKNHTWNKISDSLKKYSYFEIGNSTETTLVIKGKELSGAKCRVQFGDSGNELKNYLEHLLPVEQNTTFKQERNGDKTDITITQTDKTKKFEVLAKKEFNSPLNGERYYRKANENGGPNGINKLGLLLLDMDNLGVQFNELKNSEEHKTFDEDIFRFYNQEIYSLIQEQKLDNTLLGKEAINYYPFHFRNKIYPITAGGDDSCFIGKWNTMLDLAIDIQKEFHKYKPFKKRNLTLSGALVIFDHRFPVNRMIEIGQDAIHQAKTAYGTKNCFSIFGEVVDWKTLKNDIMSEKMLFLKDKNYISSGLLARARQSAVSMANSKPTKLSDFYKMSYFMRDKKTKFNSGEVFNNHEKRVLNSWSEEEKGKTQNHRQNRMILPIAARLAEYEKR